MALSSFTPGIGSILIPGVIADSEGKSQSLLYMLDTGASVSYIDRRVLGKLGFTPVPHTGEQIVTGSGSAAAEAYDLPFVEFLGLRKAPMRVLGMDVSPNLLAEGIIGMDFLANLKMTIDFPSGTIRILKPTKPKGVRPPAGGDESKR